MEKITGLYFYKQTTCDLNDKIIEFLKNEDQFIPEIIRENTLRFDKVIFKKKIKKFIEDKFEEFKISRTR